MTDVSAEPVATSVPVPSYAIVVTGILCAFHTRTASQLAGAIARVVWRIWRLRLALTSSSLDGCITKHVNSSPSLLTVATSLPVSTATTLSSSPHWQTTRVPSKETSTLPPVYRRPKRSLSWKEA